MTVPAVQTLTEVVESKIMQNKKVVNFSLSAWCSASWRKLLSEFLATLLLLLFGCMTCVPLEGYGTAIYSALGFGTVVMMNIQIFGHVSGAHMNPVVTISYVIYGGCDILLGIGYVIAQCLGAIAGYGLLVVLISIDLSGMDVCVTKPHPDQTSLQTVVIEAMMTSALILINCAMWDPVNKNKQDSAAIKFGLTIVALTLVGAPFTSTSLNPARSLGPAVWTSVWTGQWLYWVGPILGSIISTILYKILFSIKSED